MYMLSSPFCGLDHTGSQSFNKFHPSHVCMKLRLLDRNITAVSADPCMHRSRVTDLLCHSMSSTVHTPGRTTSPSRNGLGFGSRSGSVARLSPKRAHSKSLSAPAMLVGSNGNRNAAGTIGNIHAIHTV